MSIPNAAIEAAAEVIGAPRTYDRQCDDPACVVCIPTRDLSRAANEAAMPAIREAIAQEIEAAIPSGLRGAGYAGMKDAARIVRGGAA